MNPQPHIDLTDDATDYDIVDKLAALKMKEAEFTARRIAAEERLVTALGFNNARGSKTFTIVDEEEPDPELKGPPIRVTLKANVYDKVDPAEWEAIREEIPGDLHPVKIAYVPVAKAVKVLREEHPDQYLKFCRAFTSRPGKIGVEFKP